MQATYERLMAELDEARYVRYHTAGYLAVWFGGHGIHVYDAAGTEVHFWNVGDFSQNDASIEDVKDSIARWLVSDGEDED